MREPGNCTNCGYLIEQEHMEKSIPSELSQLDAYSLTLSSIAEEQWERYVPGYQTPKPNTYVREQWYEYYANGKRVYTCPGCDGFLDEHYS